METRRVPTRIHTRKIDRMAVKTAMKAAGLKHVMKHGKTRKVKSHFAEHWREYAEKI